MVPERRQLLDVHRREPREEPLRRHEERPTVHDRAEELPHTKRRSGLLEDRRRRETEGREWGRINDGCQIESFICDDAYLNVPMMFVKIMMLRLDRV